MRRRNQHQRETRGWDDNSAARSVIMLPYPFNRHAVHCSVGPARTEVGCARRGVESKGRGGWIRGAVLSGLLGSAISTTMAEVGPWGWFSPGLRALAQQEQVARTELAALGVPMVGQTAAEFGYQHPRLTAEPPTSPWVQVDLGRSQPIDWIALVPAQVDWQPLEHNAHAFPVRFRVDVSDDEEFATFTAVAVFTDSDFPQPGIAPVALRAEGVAGRYVRLTVTKLAVENAQHFFALAELMVVSGRRNVAIGRPVSASATVDLPPRWFMANLVDGRTPLGPPLQRELLPYDGLYAGPPGEKADELIWMGVDLKQPVPIDEVRLHPIHARFGADIPGFSFPARFRLEGSLDETFASPHLLFDTGPIDFPNPGNNPVTVPLDGVVARHVRVVLVEPSTPLARVGRRRFGLSELEVFSRDVNVARGGNVGAAPDPTKYRDNWPMAQLNDGYASYGRLMELPEWLAHWQQRARLRTHLDTLSAQRETLEQDVRRRVTRWSVGLGVGLIVATGALVLRQKRRRTRELEQIRSRLARDLHDEMGSNLAGLAVLSETLGDGSGEGTREDWREVNRIAHETTDAMREVLWLVGAREEAGRDFVTQLQRTAERVLPGRDVRWEETTDQLPAAWPMDARREAFLFFKEALANIARHAHATKIVLAVALQGDRLELRVQDNGRGFDLAATRPGVGLTSLRARAKVLRGACTIESAPGWGTLVRLRVPLGVVQSHRPPVV